jgi:transcriptional regulator with XRE-family HTH domain
MNELDRNRAEILAGLIQDARIHARRSPEECAEVLGISTADYSEIEAAGMDISLPELEVLGMFLRIPMAYFWGSLTLEEARETDYELYQSLRQRIIGALLRQARIQADRSPEELASALGTNVEQIQAYESGTQAIPYFQLEKLASELNVSVQYFSNEEHGPLAQYEMDQHLQKRFEDLPPEVKEFVAEPINLSYLETAIRLSEMDVAKLRSIAE